MTRLAHRNRNIAVYFVFVQYFESEFLIEFYCYRRSEEETTEDEEEDDEEQSGDETDEENQDDDDEQETEEEEGDENEGKLNPSRTAQMQKLLVLFVDFFLLD